MIRNGFNYTTYKFSEIDSFSIGRGKEIKNWLLLLVFGLLLIGSGIWFLTILTGVPNATGGYYVAKTIAYAILIPLLLTAFGVYCVFSAIKSGTILTLRCVDKRNEVLLLRNFEIDGRLNSLNNFLSERIKKGLTR
jgi:hypothetical protein